MKPQRKNSTVRFHLFKILTYDFQFKFPLKFFINEFPLLLNRKWELKWGIKMRILDK